MSSGFITFAKLQDFEVLKERIEARIETTARAFNKAITGEYVSSVDRQYLFEGYEVFYDLDAPMIHARFDWSMQAGTETKTVRFPANLIENDLWIAPMLAETIARNADIAGRKALEREYRRTGRLARHNAKRAAERAATKAA